MIRRPPAEGAEVGGQGGHLEIVLTILAAVAGGTLGWFSAKLAEALQAPWWFLRALRLTVLLAAFYASFARGVTLVLLVAALGFSIGVAFAIRRLPRQRR
jgi:hypothetical protein